MADDGETGQHRIEFPAPEIVAPSAPNSASMMSIGTLASVSSVKNRPIITATNAARP